jgi:hypothetical protein
MDDVKAFRVTGWFGLAVAALCLIEFPLYFLGGGPVPLLHEAAQYAEYVAGTRNLILTIKVIDIVLCVCIMIFLAGFRHLIRQARQDCEWIATLCFGAGIALVTMTFIGDALHGAAALDAVGGKADPSAIRALTEGYLLMYGSFGCMLIALITATAGYAIIASGALRKWNAWVSFVAAGLNLAAVPSIFFGTGPHGFYTAAGWGVAAIATFSWAIWNMLVGISMIVGKRRVHGTARGQY